LFVTYPDGVPLAQAAIEGTGITEIVTIGSADGATSLSELFGDPITQVEVDVAEQVVVLPYSSGTTGLAKGVMLTHRNLVANLAQCQHAVNFDDGDAILAVLPFFHIYGMQVLMNYGLANGATVISLPRFDLVRALELISEFKIAKFFAVPPMVLALAKHPVVDEHDISSLNLIVCGAAPLGAELAQEAAARISCPVVQAYGMTELSPVSHCTPVDKDEPGSSGITISNTECRFVDPDGNDQDINSDGELWVRGPQVMKGYLNNPEATAETIDADGWLHTGDVARIDANGNVFIVDRVKELIKYKGFQVPPAELEALIITHDAVADVAVIGIPEIEAGELPKAFVALKPGAEASEDDIIEFVAERVASYKKIRLVEFIDEIPKSASGKILRRFLRDS
jgi:4-coumarate--CoA ligase